MEDALLNILENLKTIVERMELTEEVIRELPMADALRLSGMERREIEALQLLVVKRQPSRILAERWHITTGRVSQIKRKALRKLRHPKRRDIVRRFRLEQYLPRDQSIGHLPSPNSAKFIRFVQRINAVGERVWEEE